MGRVKEDLPGVALAKGSRVGKYLLISRLGRGAFAEVWKALDEVENRKVALKIASSAAVTEFGRSALEHEARMASSLQHPHILGLFDSGEAGTGALPQPERRARGLGGPRTDLRRAGVAAVRDLHLIEQVAARDLPQ